jgi:hypothetical protein
MITRPTGFNKRAQAGANAAAEQFEKLSDGEIEKRAGSRGLELVRQPPAEESFDERSAERTQMIAAGRTPVRVADQMTAHRQRLRRFDRHDELVSEAERQHRGSRPLHFRKLRTRSMAISGLISVHGPKCRDFPQHLGKRRKAAGAGQRLLGPTGIGKGRLRRPRLQFAFFSSRNRLIICGR